MTSSRDLKALDAMNNLVLWITWMTLGYDHRALDAMNNIEGYGWYEWLKVPSVKASRWYE